MKPTLLVYATVRMCRPVQPATAADALPESHCGNERSISMSELCMPNHRRRFGDARDRVDVALEADGLRFLGNDEGA